MRRLSFYLMISFFLFACNSNEEKLNFEMNEVDRVIENIEINDDDFEVFNRSIMNEYSTNLFLKKTNDDGQVQYLIEQFGLAKSLESLEIVGLLLNYRNNEEQNARNSELLAGLLVYYSFQNQLFVKSFLVENNSTNEIKDLNLSLKHLTSNDFLTFGLFINQQKGYEITNQVFMRTNAAIPSSINNLAGVDFQNYFVENFNPSNGIIEELSAGCYAPCPVHDPELRCIAQESQMNGENWECWPDVCPRDEFEDEFEQDENFERKYDYDDKILYDFRDDFLKLCPNGIEYIEKYYSLGPEIKNNNIPLNILLEAISIRPIVVNIVDNLLNNNQSSAVICTNQEAEKLIKFLVNLRSISNDQNFIDSIDSIISDINMYKNKSVKDVYKEFTDC